MATAILKRRLVYGWRHDGINEVLDQCAEIDGYLFLEVELTQGRRKLDALGRQNRIYDDVAHKQRVYRQTKPEQYDKKKAATTQYKKDKYMAYCQLYIQQFPGSLPVSFSHFRKTDLFKNFNADPMSAVVSSYGIADEISRKKKEAAARFKME